MPIFSSPEIMDNKDVMEFWSRFASTGNILFYCRAYDLANDLQSKANNTEKEIDR